MNAFELVDGLIRNPPLWIISVLIPFIVVFVMKHISKDVSKLSTKMGLFEIVEMFIIGVLATLTLESAYLDHIKGESVPHDWYEDWFAILVILLLYTTGSLAAYIKYIK